MCIYMLHISHLASTRLSKHRLHDFAAFLGVSTCVVPRFGPGDDEDHEYEENAEGYGQNDGMLQEI